MNTTLTTNNPCLLVFIAAGEWMEVALKIGNNHSYDVQRTKLLVQSIAILPKDIIDNKADQDKQQNASEKKKHSKVVGISQFQLLVHRAPDLIRRIFAVQQFTRELCGGVSMWKTAAKYRSKDHEELEDLINRILEQDANIFKHGLNIKSRMSFNNHDIFVVRRNSLLLSTTKNKNNTTKNTENTQSSTYAIQDKNNSNNNDDDDDDDDDSDLRSVYHRLDFGVADKNGKFTATKRKRSYVAKVTDLDFTGPAHAADHHQTAAITLQKRGRGMAGRIKAKHLEEVEGAQRRARERQQQRKVNS
jgi:hypothetical protein